MRVYGTVNLTALAHNLSVARQYAPDSQIMGVIKSNAYGHGAVRVAQFLESSVDSFAVATVDEAVELREAQISTPICVLSGFFEPAQLSPIFELDLQVVVYCQEQIDLLADYKSESRVSVWLKVNTGMNRLGFSPQDIGGVLERLRSTKKTATIRLMSHFSQADNRSSTTTVDQINTFVEATENLNCERSIANSAGLIDYPSSHFDWVRPGIMLYGVSPIEGVSSQSLDLRPVMNAYSRLIAVNDVHPGDAVGYGGEWISSSHTRVGIVGCGYGDGFHRSMSPKAKVLIDDRPAPVIGRVSMDTFAVDLSEHSQVAVGTEVKLFGDGLPVEEQAEKAGTIGYELLTAIAGRRITLESIS